MILGMSVGFIFMGILLMILDLFLPPLNQEMYMMYVMFKMIGLGLAVIGLTILGGRCHQTGAGIWLDLPNTKNVILIHQRRGKNPNARFIKGKLTDLEFIRAKNKIFKDTGGGFRIAGHDVRRTHETIAFDIPEWLGQWLYQVKTKYGVRHWDQLYKVYKQLKNLNEKEDAEEQLNSIEELRPVLNDPAKKEVLIGMSLHDLHHMAETIWDGTSVHMEVVEEFVDSATPNELDGLEKQMYLNDTMRDRNYSNPGEVNWGKWVPALGFMLLCGAIAAIMIQGAFG